MRHQQYGEPSLLPGLKEVDLELATERKTYTAESLYQDVQETVVGIKHADGNGSGFFVHERGLIVTNRHVVDSHREVLVELSNSKEIPGAVTLSVDGFVQIVGDLTFFVRGDSNSDGTVDIADPVYTLAHLFLGQPRPSCPDAADADDSGELDISDAIYLLTFLFLGGDPPPPPFPERGGPTPGGLSCDTPPPAL